jgi:hypothetical protein
VAKERAVYSYEAEVRQAMAGRLILSELGWGLLAILWFLVKVLLVLVVAATIIGLVLLLAGFFSNPKVDGDLNRKGANKGPSTGPPTAVKYMLNNQNRQYATDRLGGP